MALACWGWTQSSLEFGGLSIRGERRRVPNAGDMAFRCSNPCQQTTGVPTDGPRTERNTNPGAIGSLLHRFLHRVSGRRGWVSDGPRRVARLGRTAATRGSGFGRNQRTPCRPLGSGRARDGHTGQSPPGSATAELGACSDENQTTGDSSLHWTSDSATVSIQHMDTVGYRVQGAG